MTEDYEDALFGELERLPYPLAAPANVEAALKALGEEAPSVFAGLFADLHDLTLRWNSIANRERGKLSQHHPSHDLPMEYRAGLAEGLEKAAHDLERTLHKVRSDVLR
jgi:hypothetical protein